MDKELADRIWRKKFNILLNNSLLPKKYQTPQQLVPRIDDLEAWEFLEEVRNDIVQEVKSGSVFVISSRNVGNGKTSWAIRLLQRYLAETALDGTLADKGMFINYTSLVTSLSDFKYRDTEEFREMYKRLKTCQLLVVDELGGAGTNKISYPLIYDIIDNRNLNQLSTIYTTNLEEGVLRDQLGERLFSRVYDYCTLIEFHSDNVRGYSLEDIEEMNR